MISRSQYNQRCSTIYYLLLFLNHADLAGLPSNMNADTFQPLGSLERNGPVILAADLQPPFEGMQDFSIAKLNFAQAAYREFARRIANHFDTAHGAQNGDIQDLWVGGNLSVLIEQHRKVMASNHAFLYSQTAIADSGHDGNVSDVARIFFDHMAGTFFAWAITWMDFFDNEKGQHFLADKPRTTTEIESFRKDPTVKSGSEYLEIAFNRYPTKGWR